MDVIARLHICAALLSLSACATVPSVQAPLTPQSNNAAKSLSARVLAPNECGLFVWTADERKQFVLFGKSQKAEANWASPTGEILLAVTSQSGAPSQGQYPQQTFATKDSHILKLDLRSAQPIENGTRYQAGTLSRQDDQGWDRVTPVVGLSVCKSTED